MKTVLLFTICLCFSAICLSQTTAIPDPNFEQALIDLGHDSGTIDGSVPTANINTITDLSINSKNIADLTGIEDFTALEILWCVNNDISSIDVSNLTVLSVLNCDRNDITSIDLSNNTALTSLKILANDLTSLDVTNNTLLEYLSCSANNLTSLNVSNNTALAYLALHNNDVASIDVSNNSLLYFLGCSFTGVTALDISNNLNLTDLQCNDSSLSHLDISNNSLLEVISCRNNQLTTLNIDNNVLLEELHCEGNNIIDLDLSNNAAILVLNCQANQLTSLNLKNGNNTSISEFGASDNANLLCIEVDAATYSTANWTDIDSQTGFSEDCSALSTNEFDLNSSITVYPNPVTTELNIALKNNQAITSIELFDMLGKKIATTKALNLDVSPYQTGIYMLKVSTKKGQISKRIIIE
ncbi:T9SS type A sorting domain-containing protein [Winogradskyella helgolandensis]|uniref:T9SS type A sorting domain-containing protein n=1 Tax=Winogradskyella helgolandensis TaxID=2697010 RepID=UPI0015CCB81C|nr:T9SS type A sorting domain-containing protein [Winogradskyella helgolandensis]